MKHDMLQQAASYTTAHQRKKRWHRIVTCLASVVIFCTTYALILPAITMEHRQCGIPEHTHSAACYTRVSAGVQTEPVCSPERLELHQHSPACLDESGAPVCGYADYVVHTHDGSCYDVSGALWCPLAELEAHTHDESCFPSPAEHTHTDECYETTSELVCEEDHEHTEECYTQSQVLICGLSDRTEEASGAAPVCGKEEIILHAHVSDCFDENGNLICGMTQVLEHVHSEDCFQTVEVPADTEPLTCTIPEGEGAHTHGDDCYDEAGELICKLEESEGHRHSGLCYGTWELTCDLEEHTHTDACVSLNTAPESTNGVVIRAVVIEEGASEASELAAGVYALRADGISPLSDGAGEINGHLTSATILVNGESYDGVSELNPGEQFAVELVWDLNRADLEGSKTWTYTLPAQIHVDDVEEAILYDNTGVRKGVYSVQNGVLTVTYDNVSDKTTTTFELNATWNQEQVEKETTVKWNDTLESTIHFNDAQIAVTKKNSEVVNLEDGGLVGIYQVGISAENAAGTVEGITLTDTLTSEKFTFCEDYFEDGGQKYDYRYTTDGGQTYIYGNFTTTSGEDNSQTFTLSDISLDKGQEYILEYGVLLNADDRMELDAELKPAGLRNTATASYTADGEEISSSVTVEDTYRAETKWVVKEQGNADDAAQKTDVPWIVTVNTDRSYAMGGAVIGDHIETAGAVYKTGETITATMTTDTDGTTQTLTWITLSDASVAAIQNTGNAVDVLFSDEGSSVRAEIEAAVGTAVTKDNISNYVFVNQSNNQFVWFTPQTDTPTTYRLDYITDISNVESGTITNSASAGWKNWIVGEVVGSFYQEVQMEKENNGVYQKDGEDGRYVDWTITITVPEGSNPIENVYLFDLLPIYTNFDYNGQEVSASDWLMGLSGDSIDYAGYMEKPRTYLDNFAKGAFTITTDSERADIQSYVNSLFGTLGNPSQADGSFWHEIYGSDQTSLGQLAVTNGQGEYADARLTPYTFGVDLGTLPGTKDGTGAYTITVQYTTQVNPARVEVLDGRDGAINYVELRQKANSQELVLANADAHYWISKTNANKSLEKSVAAFDPQNDLLTYEVLINPDGTLDYNYCNYVLRDVLDIPGARFVEGSFQLSMLGEFNEVDGNYSITLDPEKETALWPAGATNVITDYYKTRISLDTTNRDTDSSEFTLTLSPGGDGFYWQKDGKLIPLKLTYQVRLPDSFSTAAGDQDTITNSVTMTAEPGDGPQVLIDGDKTSFDYTTALHKRITVPPVGNNNYTAGFEILVDKTVDEWKTADSFTVSDTLSKSLAVDITTIQISGIEADGTETALAADAYTVAYDDRSAAQNLLSVTVTDSEKYVGYRIVYSTHLIGTVGETVAFDNIAAIDGTSIQSERVEEEVYIQTQGGSVTDTNYEVRLLKYDASDTGKRLSATFDLYAYENESWVLRVSDLKTDENGELTINNTLYPSAKLNEATWYKLVETSAPTGYLKGVTYFHIGTPSSENPDKAAFTTIPLNGGPHQIPNYKAELRLHKVSESDSSTSLSGAEFALYSDAECTTQIAAATESANGIYTFSLSGLSAGTSYYLKETKAPPGYNLSDTVYTVTFDTEGKVTLKSGDEELSADQTGAFPITNRFGYELPMTGGCGSEWYTVGGLLLICGSVCLLYKIRKRERGAHSKPPDPLERNKLILRKKGN